MAILAPIWNQAGTATANTTVVPTSAAVSELDDVFLIAMAYNSTSRTLNSATPASGSIGKLVKIAEGNHSSAALRGELWAAIVTGQIPNSTNVSLVANASGQIIGGISCWRCDESWGDFFNSGVWLLDDAMLDEIASGTAITSARNLVPATASGLGHRIVAKLVNAVTITEGTGWTSIRTNSIATLGSYRSRAIKTVITPYASSCTGLNTTGAAIDLATHLRAGDSRVSFAGTANGVSGSASTTGQVTVPAAGFPVGTLVVMCSGGLAHLPGSGRACTDTQGNVYTEILTKDHSTAAIHCAMWATIVTKALVSGNTITYSFGASVTGRASAALCCRGVDIVPDSTQTAEAAAALSIAAGNLSPLTEKGLGVYCAFRDVGAVITQQGSWVEDADVGNASPALEFELAHKIRIQSQAYPAGASAAATSNWVIAAAHFPQLAAIASQSQFMNNTLRRAAFV